MVLCFVHFTGRTGEGITGNLKEVCHYLKWVRSSPFGRAPLSAGNGSNWSVTKRPRYFSLGVCSVCCRTVQGKSMKATSSWTVCLLPRSHSVYSPWDLRPQLLRVDPDDESAKVWYHVMTSLVIQALGSRHAVRRAVCRVVAAPQEFWTDSTFDHLCSYVTSRMTIPTSRQGTCSNAHRGYASDRLRT